ncbi:hypothetical protein [Paraglaciecola sp.]
MQGLFWNYDEFPTLCFDKNQYLSELEKAQELIRSDAISMKLLSLYD